MDYASIVMKVLYGAQQLQKVVPGKTLIEAAGDVLGFDEGKQVSLLNQLEDDEENLDRLAVGLDDDLALAVILH